MADTVRLHETPEYSTMVSTWRDVLYLTQRANGTFTVKLHRQPVGDPGYAYLYRSSPFRTAHALLGAIKAAEAESSYSFDAADLDAMLTEADTIDPKVAGEARLRLERTPWDQWDMNPVDTHIVPLSPLDNPVK